MIEPLLADDELLRDIRTARSEADAMHLWWLGQSGFLLQWNDQHLLFDPYLSDSLTLKYAETNKPHVRMTRRAVAPEKLDFIDVVTSSHNHTDHLDGETLRPLLEANPSVQIIVPAANKDFAGQRLGTSPDRFHGLDDGESLQLAGFTITAVPAAHESMERDAEGRCRYLGYVVQAGRWKVYHSGDTVEYDGMAARLRPYAVDVAVLPINGRDPHRGVAGNLSGPEAARLAHDIGAKMAIPCHYDMFEFNTAGPAEFSDSAARLGQRVTVLQCGQRFSWIDDS